MLVAPHYRLNTLMVLFTMVRMKIIVSCLMFLHLYIVCLETFSNTSKNGRRIFFSRVNFICWLLFSCHSIPVLLQWHVKDPGHSAKNASGRLYLNTHTSLTQRSLSGLTMPLSRHSVGAYPETSSPAIFVRHLATVVSARLAIVDWSWPKRGISVRELIST